MQISLNVNLSSEETLALEKLCNSIMETSENIRSVAVINKNGRAIEKKTLDTVLMQDQKSEMYFMQCALQISMGRDFDDEFGEIGYIYVERKNLSMFSFPVDRHLIVVISKAGISPILLAKKIAMTIKEYINSKPVITNTV